MAQSAKRRNLLLILVDALRYDVAVNRELMAVVAPNLQRLFDKGSIYKVVSNASNTQFVMPSFLTGTLPLDHGGTNWGCRDRPPTIAETFAANGFETRLLSNCVLYDRALEFDRGFERCVVPVNRRRALSQDLEYGIIPKLRDRGDIDPPSSEIVDFLRETYAPVLDRYSDLAKDQDRIPKRFSLLRTYAEGLGAGATLEQNLLAERPGFVARRLAEQPENYFFELLGTVRTRPRFLTRFLNKVGRPLFSKLSAGLLRVKLMDSHETLVEEMSKDLAALIQPSRKPWFAMAHLMDVHSYRPLWDQFLRSPRTILRRILTAKRYRGQITQARDWSTALYLAALNALDRQVAGIGCDLSKAIDSGELCLIVTSDHGTVLRGIDGKDSPDLHRRFLSANVFTPLAVIRSEKDAPDRGCLYDSRDVSVTALDSVGLPKNLTDGRRSVLGGRGRRGVVSENAGRGYCDLSVDTLNFAVTTAEWRVYFELKGETLTTLGCFRHGDDPCEDNDLGAGQESIPARKHALDILFSEREQLLQNRNVYRPKVVEAVAAS